MKKLRWPLLIALLALAAIAVLLISQKPTILQPIGGNEPVVEPAQGGIYTEALIGSLIRLNPVLDYYNHPDRDVDRLVFSGLLKFDDRGLPQADLADSWGISRDGLVYNFSLRANANWHDGQPVTSDDVIFTLGLMRQDTAPLPADLREFWKQIEIKRLDEKTVQFRLPEPFAPFLDYLSFGVLPSHLLGEMSLKEMIDAPFNLAPVGSGPYRFDHLITENGQISGLVLTAFKEYYGQPSFIEQIAFRYYPDATAAMAAYKAGEIGGISQVPASDLPEALQAPGLNIYTSRLPSLTLIFLNLDNPEVPFLQDVNVRRALLMGLNRQWMIDNTLGGQAFLADGPIFPGTWAYYEGTNRLDYDPTQAIALLKEAGYTLPAEGGSVRKNEDGQSLLLELLYPDDATHAALAEAIRNDWAKIGVEVLPRGVAYDSLVANNLDPRKYQAALVELNLARSPDPDPYPFWHQAMATGGQNYSQWNDRQASEYLEAARVTTDLAERTRLYDNFQVRFAQELPSLPLFYPVYTYAVSSDVQGVSIGPLFDPADRFNMLTSWFLVTKKATGTQEVTPTGVTPITTP
jgi:peptide/nickel transport system substrate-binding protein